VNGEVICPNKECNKVIETFLSPELFKEEKIKIRRWVTRVYKTNRG
jgi:hypothetical protein